MDTPATHIYIPDVQSGAEDSHKPATPNAHLRWIGRYIADEFVGRPNLTIVQAGDFADMRALSWYDRGKTVMEGRRYTADIEKANEDFALLDEPIAKKMRALRANKRPRRILTLGNHEDRITRASESDPARADTVSLDHLVYAELGWEVYPFLEVVRLDGVAYSHYFYNPMTGRPYSGNNVETRLRTIGTSFTQGHQQGLLYGVRNVLGLTQNGLVAGSAYLHDEDYKGPQGNAHWRGIVVCHQVENGSYDPMFVSLDFLCRRYEGKRLREWLKEQ